MEEIDSSQRLHLDVLEEEYRRQHGVAVEWLKAEVGPGEVFENPVARVVLSDKGGWFECVDLPMEFSGIAGGPCERRFISDAEVLRLTGDLAAVASKELDAAVKSFGLLALYSRRGIIDEREAYVFQSRRGSDGGVRRSLTSGAVRPDTVPLLLRCRINAGDALPGIPLTCGVFVCLSGVGERNLMVLMPHEGSDVRDLGAASTGGNPQ
jgi:hypothetical protein